MNLRRSVKNFDMIYHSANPTEVAKQSALNSGRVVTKCPEDHAICGLTAMMDKTGLGILTAIGLKCCFHCIPKETWETVHHFDNNGASDERVKFTTTVGLERYFQNSQTIPAQVSVPDLPKIFGRMGKSNLTGFDWARALHSIWTNEENVTETFTCEAGRSCVFKQLVGQCGSVRVPVDKFCQGSVPTGSSIPETCKDLQPITNCSDAMKIFLSLSFQKRRIYPYGNSTRLEVLCDFESDGGGWTVMQKRSSGPLDEFNRGWSEYSKGFGSLDGNFWLGLENIHALTKNGDQELRIELEDFEGEKKWAKYGNFSISDASDFYRLNISGFSPDSTAGDSMTNSSAHHDFLLNGMRFSTKDKDSDKYDGNCADGGWGGWWYNNCSSSRLNGLYREKGEAVKRNSIIWRSWKGLGYSLAKTEMKIRKRKSE